MAGLPNIVEVNNGINEVVHYSAIDPLYYFAHNTTDVFHYGMITVDNHLSSGLSDLEVYQTTDDLVARGVELGVTVDLETLIM